MLWPVKLLYAAVIVWFACSLGLVPSVRATEGAALPGSASLDEGYTEMYNLAFAQAHQTFHAWEEGHPDDPLGTVSDAAAYMFSEFDRLQVLRSEFFVEDKAFFNLKRQKPDPEVRRHFEASLEQTKQQADAILRQKPNDEAAMLANVLRLALHANYEALIDKQYWQSLNDIKQARNEADILINKYSDCYDARLAAGVENYLLSQKVAPVRFILRLTGAETDKQAGMASLRLVAEKGHYLKPYAKILLAIAALRDNNKPEAKRLLEELAHEFPQNNLFRQELTKLS